MKNLIPIFLICVFASCGGKGNPDNAKSDNLLKDLSYSIDTVSLDVGDAIFNPYAYFSHEMGADGNTLYLYYEPEKEMHEYELASRKLVARHPFERDGPNAAPSHFNNFQALPAEEFFIADFAQSGIYRLDGTKLQTFRIQSENIAGLNLDPSFQLTKNSYISSDKQKLLSIPQKFGAPAAGLAIVDLEQMTGKIHALPALEMTNNFQVIYEEGMVQTGDFLAIQFLRDQFIIYSGATSDTYIYDWRTDSLRLHAFPHKLVAKNKIGKFPPKVNSEERIREVGTHIQSQITFGKFYWDQTRKSYFRIGIIHEDYSQIYLFSYDSYFALTGETLLKELYYLPYLEYFHEGKLYSFFPVGENPALIEFTFNF